jgi:hypothetical protein
MTSACRVFVRPSGLLTVNHIGSRDNPGISVTASARAVIEISSSKTTPVPQRILASMILSR